jgi:hypothetical protein
MATSFYWSHGMTVGTNGMRGINNYTIPILPNFGRWLSKRLVENRIFSFLQ